MSLDRMDLVDRPAPKLHFITAFIAGMQPSGRAPLATVRLTARADDPSQSWIVGRQRAEQDAQAEATQHRQANENGYRAIVVSNKTLQRGIFRSDRGHCISLSLRPAIGP